MTLQDVSDAISQYPQYIVGYFLFIPILVLLLGFLSGLESYQSPWKYMYSGLVYLSCIPGIFALSVFVYRIIFERSSIMSTNVLTVILPISSMLLTLILINKWVKLEYLPGYRKISGLLLTIFCSFVILWFIHKLRIVAFTFLRFEYIILLFVGIFIAIRLGVNRLFK